MEPTVEPAIGMGITRGDIQFPYQEEPNNFAFEPVSDSEGQPRLRGKSPDGAVTLFLNGPADNLTQVEMLVRMSRDREDGFEAMARHIVRFCITVVPEWDDCSNWMVEHISEADMKTISTIQGNREVSLITTSTSDGYSILMVAKAAR